ncbi:MAG: hypothetical protein MUE46_18260 [Xanthomonadales bacterium]|jgi:methionyl-tRNA formyltransferase|nr:hypothetical protein [Xanthomonadales bacterium]
MEAALRRTLVITDNRMVHDALERMVATLGLSEQLCIRRSPHGSSELPQLPAIDVKADAAAIVEQFELVISAHCKQIFPVTLHGQRECINIHPGHNPQTRGCFPQVWSILHQLPLGFTVHRIDAQLDHGHIIHRQQLPLYAWDTSWTAYQRVVAAEMDWLHHNLLHLLRGDYAATPMTESGHLFLRRDFNALLEIDLQQTGTWQAFIDHLRAVTFPRYRNAWFRDPESGRKIHISIQLDADPDTPSTSKP